MEQAPMGWQSSSGGDWVPPTDDSLGLIWDICASRESERSTVLQYVILTPFHCGHFTI
jgi:hypothetical protein